MTKKTHLLSGLILAEAVIATHIPASVGIGGLVHPAVMSSIAPAAGFALVGSIFPDIDVFFGPRDEWNSFHRTLTHWPPLYVIAGPLMYFMIHPAAIWFSMGCFVHLLLDAITKMGIPVWTPFGGRSGIKLIRTGGFGELPVHFAMAAIFMGILLAWLK